MFFFVRAELFDLFAKIENEFCFAFLIFFLALCLCMCFVRALAAINLYMQCVFGFYFMMCLTSAQFWCVICVLMCSVCAVQDSQARKNNVIWARAEVRRYIFVVRACVLVCVRACV